MGGQRTLKGYESQIAVNLNISRSLAPVTQAHGFLSEALSFHVPVVGLAGLTYFNKLHKCRSLITGSCERDRPSSEHKNDPPCTDCRMYPVAKALCFAQSPTCIDRPHYRVLVHVVRWACQSQTFPSLC